jgi:hypothetical protein
MVVGKSGCAVRDMTIVQSYTEMRFKVTYSITISMLCNT